jgi:hypothetical protein
MATTFVGLLHCIQYLTAEKPIAVVDDNSLGRDGGAETVRAD